MSGPATPRRLAARLAGPLASSRVVELVEESLPWAAELETTERYELTGELLFLAGEAVRTDDVTPLAEAIDICVNRRGRVMPWAAANEADRLDMPLRPPETGGEAP